MASLAEIFGAMAEVDQVKEAQVAEANGEFFVDEDTMEKAAHYDAIGRRLAHQVFAQVTNDPDLMKEAQGGMPPAFAAMAAKAKGGEGEGESEEEEESEEEKAKKKAKKDGEASESSDEEKMEEKKAAVLHSMHHDEEYFNYIVDKYLTS
jgi:hypothetical protein